VMRTKRSGNEMRHTVTYWWVDIGVAAAVAATVGTNNAQSYAAIDVPTDYSTEPPPSDSLITASFAISCRALGLAAYPVGYRSTSVPNGHRIC